MAEQKKAFAIGDLVQLRSGGPSMTVQDKTPNGNLVCQWFGGKKLERGVFDPKTVIPAPEPEEKK
jgi:uncharacterized protein YodC (DUF2158 family)